MTSRDWRLLLAVLLAWTLAGPAWTAPAAPATAAEARAALALIQAPVSCDAATLRLLNRDILTFRSTLAGTPPVKRVERALERIRLLLDAAMSQPLRVLSFDFGGTKGVQIMLGEPPLLAIVDG